MINPDKLSEIESRVGGQSPQILDNAKNYCTKSPQRFDENEIKAKNKVLEKLGADKTPEGQQIISDIANIEDSLKSA